MFKSEIPKLLKEMEEHSENFEAHYINGKGPYYILHTPTGRAYWTCSGLWFYGLYYILDRNKIRHTRKVHFTFADKVRFHFAYRKLKAKLKSDPEQQTASLDI
jgi:hypothetical protein